jgi:hypothetical protein
MTNMHGFQSNEEITAVVKGFESCETDKTVFKHQDHLVVAVAYLNDLTVPEAVERMRTCLLRFVAHHKVDQRKYNETITVFWIEMVAQTLAKMDRSLNLVDRCNRVVQEFPNAALTLDYYSSELLNSDEAREHLVLPDLKDWKNR